MNQHAETFLYELLSIPSPTGFEAPGQRKWASYVGQFADALDSDAYGNVWAKLDGSDPDAPTIMLEAHADEIGYIVKYITKEGFLHIDRLGGSDAATGRGRRVDILGDKGPVRGVIGNTAIHLRRDDLATEKAPKIHELFIDVGADSAEDVQKLGIRVGHPAVYVDAAEPLGKDRIVGRALDNRIGGFIIACVLEALSKRKKRPTANLVIVNAVQEEIGGLGAKMVAHRLSPDVAIVLDVTHATDTPGISKAKHGEVKLGKGPSLTHGACNHPQIVDHFITLGRKKKIPLQMEAAGRYSGTDTDQIYHIKNGIPSALVSLPLRYMHSVIETAHLKDIDHTVNLLEAFLLSINKGDDFKVQIETTVKQSG